MKPIDRMAVVAGDFAARLGGIGVALGRTWRFRRRDRPHERQRVPTEPGIYVTWHEYLLVFSLFARGTGFASLVSRSADGDLIARIAGRLGYHIVRGSSSRGGSTGLRGLMRAASEGRQIATFLDGPRGPRHDCKPGAVRLAAQTGLPLVPMAAASPTGLRLNSWDRFFLPLPWARVYMSFGTPISVGRDDSEEVIARRLVAATHQQVARAEVVAREARFGSAYRERRSETARETGSVKGSQGRLERRARRAWTRTPPIDLSLASGVFRAARATRHALYDTGVIAAESAPAPTISVGGITIGGSGKTPIVSDLAAWLTGAGRFPAILTRGYRDEMALHRALRPGVPVWGHPDRCAIARRAVAARANVLLLDDGFQHRRLARDLDIVAIDRDALRRTNGRALPAGPFRDSVRRAAGHADWLVLIGREPRSQDVIDWEARWLSSLPSDARVAVASIETDRLRTMTFPGDQWIAATPALAVTGVMKPNLFFETVRKRLPSIVREHALPDHGMPGEVWEELLETAGSDGLVTTAKDIARFGHLVPPEVPVWFVEDHLVWHSNREELERAVLEAASAC